MINIPENYQIIILGIVLLLLGYYALVLNKKVEGFGCGWSDPGACLREIRDLKNKLKNAIPSIDSVFNPIKDWFNNNLLNKINDIKNKISDLPEKAKNKILEILEKPISFVKDLIQKAKDVFKKVFNTIKNIVTTMVNFIKDKLQPFIGDKLNFIKTFVMDKISPILNKTLGFVTDKLKKVWEIAINATGIPDMLQTGYYITLGFLVCGIALNSFSIFSYLVTPVKCLECSCTCD
tara:strand:- start:10415 stop:11119 length:705 start_codon:yes stop_codon:yes gene_type:complete